MNTYERSFTYNKEVFILRILVCVKQVPDTAEIKIDPVTNTLIRAGVPSIVNPFDACALEVAARIKTQIQAQRLHYYPWVQIRQRMH